MYFDYLVPVPQVEGKISRSPNKNGPYVRLEIAREYKPELKYNVAIRETIGKIADEEKMLMYPNENYLKHFPASPLLNVELKSLTFRKPARGEATKVITLKTNVETATPSTTKPATATEKRSPEEQLALLTQQASQLQALLTQLAQREAEFKLWKQEMDAQLASMQKELDEMRLRNVVLEEALNVLKKRPAKR